MAKDASIESIVLSVDSVNDAMQAAQIGAHTDFPISREEAFAFFAAADDKDFVTLGGAEYLDFEKLNPGKYVFMFTGFTSWRGKDKQTGEEKEIDAVMLEMEDGSEFICAAKLIVDNCRPITQMPCLIRVVHGGKKRAGNGNSYFDLKVQVGKQSIKG
jgi:hypothetical protein